MDNVSVRDNGGTGDRYTIVFWDHGVTVTSTDHPTHPNGVFSSAEFCEVDIAYLDFCQGDYDDLTEDDDEWEVWAIARESIGPAIKWSALPEALRTYLESWIVDIAAE